MRRYLHPLQLESEESHIAMSFPPHYMTDEEVLEFPNFARSVQISYLILRNTIITLWNLNVKVSIDDKVKELCCFDAPKEIKEAVG